LTPTDWTIAQETEICSATRSSSPPRAPPVVLCFLPWKRSRPPWSPSGSSHRRKRRHQLHLLREHLQRRRRSPLAASPVTSPETLAHGELSLSPSVIR
jgi:hypothetical protein